MSRKYIKNAPKKNPIAGGKKEGRLVRPSSCCFSTAAIAGDKRDQKLAAIITPPVNPRAASRNFLLAYLKKNTRLAPRAVNIQVNNPATKACKIGFSNEMKKPSNILTKSSIISICENNKTKEELFEKIIYLHNKPKKN